MSIRSFSYRSVFLPEAYEQEAEVAWNQFARRRGIVSSKTTCSQDRVPSIIITDPAQSAESETSFHRYQGYNELLDRSNNIDDLFQDVICQFEHCLDLTYQGTDNISEITDPQHVNPCIKDRSLVKDSELFGSCSTISTATDTILADVDNTMDLFSNAIESIQCCIEEVEQCCPLRNLAENV